MIGRALVLNATFEPLCVVASRRALVLVLSDKAELLHDWENVVAACRRCNTRKEDRLPEEAGFVLRRPPRPPRSRVWLLAVGGELRSEWAPYVGRALEHAGCGRFCHADRLRVRLASEAVGQPPKGSRLPPAR